MSGYILCQTKKAENPYYIENISTNIYSIEELCYYLYHNLYLVDNSIINESLCTWLSEELGLTKLAAKLKPHVGKFASAEDILYPIFKEINYLTYEELRKLNGQLSKMDMEAPAMREKRKGDLLVENRMYVNAIRVYRRILERDNLGGLRDGFVSDVYHNLGCAYSYLFQMEKAMECFWKAYEEDKTQKSLKCYLLAFKSVRSKDEYQRKLKELEADDELKKAVKDDLDRFSSMLERPVPAEKIDEMLEEFTREYHRSTGA